MSDAITPMTRIPPLAFFAGKRILMLQGPVGPFFRRLAADLKALGADVKKVNFNGGDWIYHPDAAITYTGTLDDWAGFLNELLLSWKPDVIFLYNDTRPVHDMAIQLAQLHAIDVFTFEEGYVRPDFITLERGRANGHSAMMQRQSLKLLSDVDVLAKRECKVGYSFLHLAWRGFWYHAWAWLLMPLMPGHTYHRGLGGRELIPQVRSYWRKLCYHSAGRALQKRLSGDLSRKFFLVPLQVSVDSQIVHHSKYAKGGVPAFMREVTSSFARHAPQDTHLVFKHHPMDRGYTAYFDVIDELRREFPNLRERLHYVFDINLPLALDNAAGVVVINSTVGLSAIMHGTAVKVHGGRAIYDLEGLTAQIPLDDFWQNSWRHRPDTDLAQRFRSFLIHTCQINGNFYRRLPHMHLRCGLNWPEAWQWKT